MPGYITKMGKQMKGEFGRKWLTVKTEQLKDKGCESLLQADRGNEGVHCTVCCTW